MFDRRRVHIMCLAKHECLTMHDAQKPGRFNCLTKLAVHSGSGHTHTHTHTRLFRHDPSTKGLKVCKVIFNTGMDNYRLDTSYI